MPELAELRTLLEVLPLGQAQDAVLAVVETMQSGAYVEQAPGSSWKEAIKREWMQSGDTCAER